MKAILACTLLLTGCAAYRVSPGDDGALRAVPVKGSSEIAVTQVRGPLQGFQCFEPLFFTLTLGLIPANCVDTFAVSVTSSFGETVKGTYKSSIWFGWVSVFLAPLPKWHWQMGTGDAGSAKEIERRVRAESQ